MVLANGDFNPGIGENGMNNEVVSTGEFSQNIT